MFVNIRGTGGSGKSTVVRRVMELYAEKHPQFLEGRRQPIAYRLNRAGTALSPLLVPGHYETACGGCDTIKTPDQVYSLLTEAFGLGMDGLYEGIIVQDDVTRALDFAKLVGRENFLVIGLTTPLDVCLEGIQARRDERGDTRELNPKNTTSRADRVKRSLSRLADAGITVKKLDREAAFEFAKGALSLGE